MAKAPEMTDRFRIFAETTSEAMGPLLAQLTRMGLENIGYELITDVATFKSRKNKTFDISGEELAERWIAEHPTFQINELVKHFEAEGRNRKSAYPSVRGMVEAGTLIKLGPGNYRRSDVKAIAPPKSGRPVKANGKPKRPANPIARYDIPNRTLILNAIKNRKRFTVKEMEALFTEQGRNQKSVSPLINKLMTDKIVKQVEVGTYAVNKDATAKAIKASTPKPKRTTTAADAKRELRNRQDRERAAARRAAMNGQQPPSEETHG